MKTFTKKQKKDFIEEFKNNGANITLALEVLDLHYNNLLETQINDPDFKTEMQDIAQHQRENFIIQAQAERTLAINRVIEKDKKNKLKPGESLYLSGELGRIHNQDRSINMKIQQEMKSQHTLTIEHKKIEQLGSVPTALIEQIVEAEFEEVKNE